MPTPGNRFQSEAIARIRQTLGEVIAERREGSANHDDLVTAMLAPGDHGGPALADTVAVDHATTFIAAPTATVASTLGWVFHLLAQHPGIVDSLRTEVDTVLAGEPAGFEHLLDLKLARRIITETLRLYPSLWLGTRVVTTDTRLGGHLLTAGTVVSYGPCLVGRSGLYDNPDSFDPDRWDDSPKRAASPRPHPLRRGRPPMPRQPVRPHGEGPRPRHDCITLAA
ncbi:cytochrome P450 [Streptomyces sp. NPDC020681]|uniref:cytochrome P450 n=1 Tax=Streptomyces sp. NPDC020681 TaxID=3365083 RepID=UPI003796C6CD